jgi:calcium-dependent protein kinase
MNRYILQEKLGSGGYSSVYRCTDHVGVRYACKVLPIKENKRSRVQQEIEILTLLRDTTKVIKLVEACEDIQSFYIIQEWCKGGDIKDYLGTKDMYGENTVASIVRGTLRGLYHIHKKGIIHMDIKGPNILFADKTDDAEIKLVDFGAAIINNTGKDTIETNGIVGTPWFISPEALGHTVSYKSDIWSVGVLAYQLLSGRMPFNDFKNPHKPSAPAIFRSIFMDEPSFEKQIWKGISDEAKSFIKMCLCKDFKKRPSAEKALQHIWLTQTDCSDRFKGEQLVCTPFRYEDYTLMKAKSILFN